MKKYIWRFLIFLLISAVIVFYLFNRSATAFSEKKAYFFIPSDSAQLSYVTENLEKKGILKSTRIFNWLAGRTDYATKVKPGKYKIEKGMSQAEVLRLLLSGKQEPVKFVINKFRTKEDFSRYAARNLECDSLGIMQFFQSPDSLRRFDLDSNTAMTMIIPNTYSFFWNTSVSKLFKKLYSEKEIFWNEDRRKKASQLGLTYEEVYTLASIVEEETNKNDEKPVVASVYLNRLQKGMALGADPTIKFALKDFGLKRIRSKHIEASASSPFNTYRNKGLPPGPICTPSIKTIDAVLDAEKTDFLFFCARADFSGYHSFAVNYEEHMRNANAYQKALDSLLIK
jgi:UPF0755 protein